jgi:hypothetical protein
MKRYEQPIKMAPHVTAGLIGKAQAPHIERRGYQNPIKIALRLAAERQGAAGARLIIFASTATSGGITARPNKAQRHVTNLREKVSTALGARLFYLGGNNGKSRHEREASTRP